ncbi:hypothetical protein SteCoe_14614 [Stentor coeruleus]|uniref:MSP domain-containing protein n=1 Tax=Stentor coeruleus TaxID=5963 RepID=A0A1R2C5K5_9CILI|nr:hypothetical protein SteCoe_14614 [Stentor coeruleus]
MEGIRTLKPDSTLDNFNPKRQLSKKLPPYLQKMNEVDKEINKKFIQSMNKKITFLKNPRELPSVNNPKLGILAKDNPFRLNPECIVFTDYEEGGVYEIPLIITNVSGLLRRIMVLPPSTEMFSIAQTVFPDSEMGLVAPGMSAKVLVHFHAASLAEFDDEFMIKTEQNTIKVPLRARREPPHLTLQDIMECGTTWVGDRADLTFRCQNLGGSAGFKFFHEDESKDPDLGDEILVTGPFTIFPLQFYLATGQFIDIYVCYQPTLGGPIENKIILACDNQTSKFYTLKGIGATLSLNVIQIDDKKLNFEENPLNAIWFEESHPKSECSRVLHIQNASALPVNYHWSTYVNSDEVISLEAQTVHYAISPYQGTMPPNSSHQFKITFSPTSSHPFNEYADLFVENIPIQSLMHISKQLQESALFKDPSALFLGSNGKFPPIPYIKFNLHGEGRLCHLEFDPPFYLFPYEFSLNSEYSATAILKNSNNGDVSFNLQIVKDKTSDYCSCELPILQGTIPAKGSIEIPFKISCSALGVHESVILCNVEHGLPIYFLVKAICIGPNIKISSAECDFGIVRCGTRASMKFSIMNLYENEVAVLIKAKNMSVRISPSTVKIPAKESVEVEVEVYSETVQKVQEIVKVRVENGMACYISLSADIQKPLVYLDCYEFVMGSLSAGVPSKEKRVTLYNYGNVSAKYAWDKSIDGCAFNINPANGEIQPRTSQVCSFTVTPFIGGSLNQLWMCQIEGMDSEIGVFTAANVKGLEIAYVIHDESVNVNSKHGNMLPSLYNASERQSFISSMTLSIPPEQHLKIVDFATVNIREPKTLKFLIKNNSGLSTTFDLKFEKYEPSRYHDEVAAEKQAKETKANQYTKEPTKVQFSKSTKFNSFKNKSKEKLPPLLTDAHEHQNKFSTKEGETFTATKKLETSQKFYLGNNQGIAFVCEPRKGQLAGYGEQLITVTMYNDICGRFEDILVSCVKGLKPYKIPVRCKVKGSPLNIVPNQLGINYKSDPIILSLGTVPIKGSLSRKIKLFNSGPKPISLFWKIFNYASLANRNDDIFKVTFVPTSMASISEDEKPDIFDLKFQALEPQESTSAFEIQPKSAIILGKSEFSFLVTFYSDEETLHQAIALAHPAIEGAGEDAKLGEIGFLLQARTLKPFLHVDKVQRADGAYYLSFDAYAIGGPTGHKEISLTNITTSPLSFSITIENGPFIITGFKNSAALSLQDYEGGSVADAVENLKLKKSSSNMPLVDKHVLAPEDNLLLNVKLIKPNANDIEIWPEVARSSIKGRLAIKFSNNEQQFISLEARLYRPKIVLASSQCDEFKNLTEQDFGVVNTQYTKKLTIFMLNVSPVDAKWEIKYMQFPKKPATKLKTMTKKEKEDASITDDPDVFIFSVTEGNIFGPTVPLKVTPTGPALPLATNPDDKIPIAVHILFKPKLALLYKSMFRVWVKGGPDIDFVLKGLGSFEEHHDA